MPFDKCPQCGYVAPVSITPYENTMSLYEKPDGNRVVMNAKADVIKVGGVDYVRVDEKTNKKVEIKANVKPSTPASTPVTPNAPTGSTVKQTNTPSK